MIKLIVATVLCTAAIISQISTASAQYYPPGGYYYYGSPAGIYYGPPDYIYYYVPQDLGWVYTRHQPVGYSEPYPAARMPDGTLGCEYSNYRPIRGRCQRIW